LNLSSKNIILLALTSMFSAILGVIIYASWISPMQRVYMEETQKAMLAAEHDLLFSNKLQRLFNSSTPTDFINAAKNSREAVVFIRSLKKLKEDHLLSDSYGSETGSGVIISPDGYIVTNNHVVSGGDQVEVLLNDNKEYKATVIGTDASTDLALLKIESENLDFLVFGDSDSLQVGEWVMAIGNPFRLQSTVTAGIVSAKARNINILENQGIESFIQTDAAVNAGNSGGALVNTRGELMGINTAIMTLSGNYEGFSFAIPSNLVKKIINDLKEYGSVQRGWLGVELESIDNTRATELGLKDVEGVYLTVVNKDGAAHDAGLISGDAITMVNNKKIVSLPQFMEYIGTYKPGDVLTIHFMRNGKEHTAKATLRNQLNTTDLVAVRKDKELQDLGFEVRELDTREKMKHKSNGVIVISVLKNSKIDQVRMEPGFVITKANGKKVESVNQLIEQLKTSKTKLSLEGFYENYPGEFPYLIDMK
jgi:serine protease Do